MSDLVRVEITNTTKAPRVIHGGEKGDEPFRVEPGETKEAILPRPLLERLIKIAAKAKAQGHPEGLSGAEALLVDKGPWEAQGEPADALPSPIAPKAPAPRQPRQAGAQSPPQG